MQHVDKHVDNIQIKISTHASRHIYKQTDQQAVRLTYRQLKDIHARIHTYNHTDRRLTEKQKYSRYTYKHTTGRHTYGQTKVLTHKRTDRKPGSQKDILTDRRTDMQMQTNEQTNSQFNKHADKQSTR